MADYLYPSASSRYYFGEYLSPEIYPWIGQRNTGKDNRSAFSPLLFPPERPVTSPIVPQEELTPQTFGGGVVLDTEPYVSESDKTRQAIDERIANSPIPIQPYVSDRDRRIQAIDQRIANSPIPIEPYVSPKMADTQTNSSFMDNLGGLLFGGGGDGMEGYLSEKQQKAIQNQAMMQAAASLLKSSGVRTTPISLGEALGEAYGAGTAGYQQAQQGAIQQLMTRQKLDEYKRQKEMQGNVGKFLGQTAPEGMSANEFKAQQYMKLSDLYAASNPEQASKFFDMAQKLVPREKVSGQPFEVADETGKPVMVQQFESGDIRTMSGYGPKRDVVLQNVDGRIIAIDKTKLTGGETYGTGVTPAERERLAMERRRLNLSEAEFKRGQYDRMDNEDGVFYVPKTPGLPVIPISGPTGALLKGKAPPKATEGETNAAGFANQMENAEAIIKKLPTGAQPGIFSSMAGSVPFVGNMAQRTIQPAQTQQYKQAAETWIRSKLRKESGAAIGKDEMEQEFRTYFPQVGDSDTVITQKAAARQIATDAMKKSAGKSYTPLSSGLNWNPATQQWE